MSKQYKYRTINPDEVKVGLECWRGGCKRVISDSEGSVFSYKAYSVNGNFRYFDSAEIGYITRNYQIREEIKTVTKCDGCPMLGVCLNRTITNKSNNCPLEYIKYKSGEEFRPETVEG